MPALATQAPPLPYAGLFSGCIINVYGISSKCSRRCFYFHKHVRFRCARRFSFSHFQTIQPVQTGARTTQIIDAFAHWQHPLTESPKAASVPCLTNYTTFDGQVYYGTIAISEADLATFSALSASNCVAYAKDQNHVYIGNMGLAYKIVPGADPNSFTPFFDASGLILYSEDNFHVYETEDIAIGISPTNVGIEKIANADRNTFLVLYDKNGYFTGYAKDEMRVYYFLNSIPSANPANFVVLRGVHGLLYRGSSGYFDAGFGKDNAHAFYGADQINGVDVASFAPINTPSGFWTPYGEDENNVYCEKADLSDNIVIVALPFASPPAFTPETDSSGSFTGYAHDEVHRWHDCTLVT